MYLKCTQYTITELHGVNVLGKNYKQEIYLPHGITELMKFLSLQVFIYRSCNKCIMVVNFSENLPKRD